MIAWTDVESCGLNPKVDPLLEVAVVLTDDDLNVLPVEDQEGDEAQGFNVIIKPDNFEQCVERLDPYVRDMHTRNGLIEDVRNKGVIIDQARDELRGLVLQINMRAPMVESGRCEKCKLGKKQHLVRVLGSPGVVGQPSPSDLVCANGESFVMKMDVATKHVPLAGATIVFDRNYLREYVPMFEGSFSHRSIDVSAIRELAIRWAPAVYELRPKNEEAHRALPDILGTINLLKWYRDSGFVGSSQATTPLNINATVKHLTTLGLKVTR